MRDVWDLNGRRRGPAQAPPRRALRAHDEAVPAPHEQRLAQRCHAVQQRPVLGRQPLRPPAPREGERQRHRRQQHRRKQHGEGDAARAAGAGKRDEARLAHAAVGGRGRAGAPRREARSAAVAARGGGRGVGRAVRARGARQGRRRPVRAVAAGGAGQAGGHGGVGVGGGGADGGDPLGPRRLARSHPLAGQPARGGDRVQAALHQAAAGGHEGVHVLVLEVELGDEVGDVAVDGPELIPAVDARLHVLLAGPVDPEQLLPPVLPGEVQHDGEVAGRVGQAAVRVPGVEEEVAGPDGLVVARQAGVEVAVDHDDGERHVQEVAELYRRVEAELHQERHALAQVGAARGGDPHGVVVEAGTVAVVGQLEVNVRVHTLLQMIPKNIRASTKELLRK